MLRILYLCQMGHFRLYVDCIGNQAPGSNGESGTGNTGKVRVTCRYYPGVVSKSFYLH